MRLGIRACRCNRLQLRGSEPQFRFRLPPTSWVGSLFCAGSQPELGVCMRRNMQQSAHGDHGKPKRGWQVLKQCRVHEAAGVSEKQARDWHAKASCRQPTWAWACEAQSRTSPERFEKADSQAACPTIAEQVAPHSFNCQTLQYSIEAIAEPQACRHSDPFLSRSRPLSHSCFLPA